MADATRPGPEAVPSNPDAHAERLPKLCGADVELGNFLLGVERAAGSGAEASRALLREIDGFPDVRPSEAWPDRRDAREGERGNAGAWGTFRERDRRGCDSWAGERHYPVRYAGYGSMLGLQYRAQDWGRRFLANGGCAYVDLDHLEICLPEVLSAADFVAAWHAMLQVVRQALVRANARQANGRRIQVLVNTSDGSGNSYGSHVNVLVTRRAFDNLFQRKLQYLLHLAAFHASAIVYTGQGKVGSENGTPHADYQVSQRADFLETLTGPQTTLLRPIVNSRDEALCGARTAHAPDPACHDMARLHVIACDSTLCQVATFLKIGTLQVVLAMIEAECVDRDLMLDDPLDAVVCWSHDPTLAARARTVSGEAVTAVQMQQRFLDAAARFVARGGCQGVVPGAAAILDTWERTLRDLESRDWDALAGSLDWVLKRSLLAQAIERRPHLTWRSPEVKHLDHLFSSLDPDEGLYWACERAGVIEPVVDAGRIAELAAGPPADTRAWTRGTLLARAGRGEVTDADWDRVRVSVTDARGCRRTRAVDLANPLGWTREAAGAVFEHAGNLEEVLHGLDGLLPADELAADPQVPASGAVPSATRLLPGSIVH